MKEDSLYVSMSTSSQNDLRAHIANGRYRLQAVEIHIVCDRLWLSKRLGQFLVHVPKLFNDERQFRYEIHHAWEDLQISKDRHLQQLSAHLKPLEQ